MLTAICHNFFGAHSSTSVPEGHVTGRGCSTKDKVFYKECETHSYGDTVEKMCFCSFFLCNEGARAAGQPPHAAVLAAAAAAVVLAATAAANLNLGGDFDGGGKDKEEGDSSSTLSCDTRLDSAIELPAEEGAHSPRPDLSAIISRHSSHQARPVSVQ